MSVSFQMCRRAALFVVLTLFVTTGNVAAADENPSKRWEGDIAKIEKRLEETDNPQGRLLFIGSSSIRMWKLEQSFPDRRTLNHGFGGSEIADSNHYFSRLVTAAKPSVVVLYAGDNDLAKGKTVEIVLRDFRQFVALAKEQLRPGTPICFIAIKPSLKRWSLADTIQSANAAVQAECDADPQLWYVDVWKPMLADDATPRKDVFLADGLHMNEAGYQIWKEALVPVLKQIRQQQNPQNDK
ncbi:MAG: hypothetical protein KDA85_20295 [Planctomycetaceae bacterium]|nr:hypothetical protein [Planctomycetaceae bacterium]